MSAARTALIRRLRVAIPKNSCNTIRPTAQSRNRMCRSVRRRSSIRHRSRRRSSAPSCGLPMRIMRRISSANTWLSIRPPTERCCATAGRTRQRSAACNLPTSTVRANPCYPAAAAALEYGVAVEGATTGLEAGGWWLPSVEEVYLLMHDRVLTADDVERDPVNRTLARLGKTTCYGSGVLSVDVVRMR